MLSRKTSSQPTPTMLLSPTPTIIWIFIANHDQLKASVAQVIADIEHFPSDDLENPLTLFDHLTSAKDNLTLAQNFWDLTNKDLTNIHEARNFKFAFN